jgi:hypothetical protein
MPFMRPYFALAFLSVALVSSSPAKSKPKNMSIWMMPLESCDAWFYVEQEPNPRKLPLDRSDHNFAGPSVGSHHD